MQWKLTLHKVQNGSLKGFEPIGDVLDDQMLKLVKEHLTTKNMGMCIVREILTNAKRCSSRENDTIHFRRGFRQPVAHFLRLFWYDLGTVEFTA